MKYITNNMGIIANFMRHCLEKKEIPLSWGISNIVTSKNYICFDVFGSKYQGTIEIIEIESMISVSLKDDEKTFTTPIELLKWLDETIE